MRSLSIVCLASLLCLGLSACAEEDGSLDVASEALLDDTGPGYYWVCDEQTGEYVCGLGSPYGHCQYETWNGVIGYLSTGEHLVGFYFDCRDYLTLD